MCRSFQAWGDPKRNKRQKSVKAWEQSQIGKKLKETAITISTIRSLLAVWKLKYKRLSREKTMRMVAAGLNGKSSFKMTVVKLLGLLVKSKLVKCVFASLKINLSMKYFLCESIICSCASVVSMCACWFIHVHSCPCVSICTDDHKDMGRTINVHVFCGIYVAFIYLNIQISNFDLIEGFLQFLKSFTIKFCNAISRQFL